MKYLDVLGDRPERREAFSPQLLAETTDVELQDLVARAARELDTPIALVTLVLDQIQLFKAHVGLPPDLAAARGTRRDASFCQFVVRDGLPFEVQHAAEDERVPQSVVLDFGIQAYLGIPIHVQGTVIGALCVLDTKPRSFSSDEREALESLARVVDHRLETITAQRRDARAVFTHKTMGPALEEARTTLVPIRNAARAGFAAVAAVASFTRLAECVSKTSAVVSPSYSASLSAAQSALASLEEMLHDVAASVEDCEDGLLALEHLTQPAPAAHLSSVLIAAQDLARPSTQKVGGATLPEITTNPLLLTPRPLAVALISGALQACADRLAKLESNSGMDLQLDMEGDFALVTVATPNLPYQDVEAIAKRLRETLGEDPTLKVDVTEDEDLRLAFAIIQTPEPR